MEAPAPSDSGFNEWTPVISFMNTMSHVYGDFIAKRWVLDRLKSGVLSAVSRTSRTNRHGDEPRSFQRMAPELWEFWDDYGDSHFWSTGDAKFEIPAEEGSDEGDLVIRFQDVRLDPATLDGKPHFLFPPDNGNFPLFSPPSSSLIRKNAPTSGLTELDPEDDPNKPAISPAALKAWYEAFKLAYPDGPNRLAESSAKGAFPRHRVARDRVRDLLPSGTMGRPKKTDP